MALNNETQRLLNKDRLRALVVEESGLDIHMVDAAIFIAANASRSRMDSIHATGVKTS